jgi:hypothetical protein
MRGKNSASRAPRTRDDTCGIDDDTETDFNTLMRLDKSVLKHARTLGWAGLSQNYLRAGKELINITGGCVDASISHATAIEFLGAYRKIMIDYILTYYIRKISDSQSAQTAYKSFLKASDDDNEPNKMRDLIRFSALGSTNPTSDYDVTLSGPALHCVLHATIQIFARAMQAAEYMSGGCKYGSPSDDAYSMSYMFDSNFYTGPEILVRTGDTRLESVTLFYPHAHDAGKEYRVAVPVPTTPASIFAERASIMKKRNQKPDERTLRERYASLVRVTRDLDAMVYKRDRPLTELEVIQKMLAVKEASIEAYYGVSTVLVVVYGMQAAMGEGVKQLLRAENYTNACLENLFDFRIHWSDYMRKIGTTRTEETDKVALIKLSKYLQRVLVCIEGMNAKLDAKARLHLTDASLAAEIEVLVKGRATGKADSIAHLDLARYGIPRSGELTYGGGNNHAGLVHAVYAYLMAPRSTKRGRAPHHGLRWSRR